MNWSPQTALVVVDCQNDFADPKGSLYVTGADSVITGVNQAVTEAMKVGSPIFYTQDWHPATTPHFQKDGGIWPVHCVGGTWGAEFHPSLVVSGPTVKKGANGEDGYSGFTMRDPVSGQEIATELDSLLRTADIGAVVVTGLALDYCVKATALDAIRLGYETSVPRALTAAVDLAPGDGKTAFEELAQSGAMVDN